MPTTIGDKVRAVSRTVKGAWNKWYPSEGRDSEALRLAKRYPSNTRMERHEWLAARGGPQDVTDGEPVLKNSTGHHLEIANRTFMDGYSVRREDIEDDKLGLLSDQARAKVIAFRDHKAEKLFEELEGTGDAYDGNPLFFNGRVIGKSGPIDNVIAGTGISFSQFQADLQTCREGMRGFKQDDGKAIGKVGNLIVIPGALEQIAFRALNPNADMDTNRPVPASDGVSMFQALGYTVLINHTATDNTDWYYFRTTDPIVGPLALQMRLEPQAEFIDDPKGVTFIEKGELRYYWRARYQTAPGEPRVSMKVQNAA